MKKIIPVLAVLGSAVAFAVYKMKKEEQKQLMDLDEGLLEEDDEPSFQKSETIIHEPIQQEEEDETINFFKKEDILMDAPIAKEIEPDFAPQPEVSDIEKLMKESAEEVAKPMQEEAPVMKDEPKIIPEPVLEPVMEPVMEPVIEPMQEEPIEEDVFSEEYPHLTLRMIQDINTMTAEAIQALAADGDVHDHERPVQHMVAFTTKEEMEGFKSRVINRGFVITKGEAEFDLVVLHISPIDEGKLVANILYLADQAYAFNGEYRGWQSKVSY